MYQWKCSCYSQQFQNTPNKPSLVFCILLWVLFCTVDHSLSRHLVWGCRRVCGLHTDWWGECYEPVVTTVFYEYLSLQEFDGRVGRVEVWTRVHWHTTSIHHPDTFRQLIKMKNMCLVAKVTFVCLFFFQLVSTCSTSASSCICTETWPSTLRRSLCRWWKSPGESSSWILSRSCSFIEK